VSSIPERARWLRVDAVDLGTDAVALDALAHFALIARRCGFRISVRRASPELVELIELAGLTDALAVDSVSSGSTPPRC
jgi:hypothetical protein